MLLHLSHFKLNSYVVLVMSKQKGITLVFKTDPLQNVDIDSTFNSITVIQNFIQCKIEGQLHQMFHEDLPGIIHRLSQQWVKAKVEAPSCGVVSSSAWCSILIGTYNILNLVAYGHDKREKPPFLAET